MHRLPVICCALLLLAACGGDRGPTEVTPLPPDTTSTQKPDTTSAPDTTTPPIEWTPFIGRTFTLAAGTPGVYRCTAIQAASDLYITGFHLQAPANSFRTLVTVSDDPFYGSGDFDCTAALGTIEDVRLIYAAGSGTDDFLFPSGTGIHVKAGQYVQLNVAGQNRDGTADMIDTTQVLIRAGKASDVTTEAEMAFVGTFNINIPSDGQQHTATGGCPQPVDQHLLAIVPMMNRLATRQRIVDNHAGVEKVLLDTAFTVTHQQFYPVDDTLYAGDQLQLVASYVNNTGSTVSFGDLYTAAWGMAALYLTPVTGQVPFACTS